MDPDCVKDRFQFAADKAYVKSLGRPKLQSIIDAHSNNKKVFVWGNKGGGKSHLMNMFAFLKFCEHVVDIAAPRLLWLPHLGAFAVNLAGELFKSLVLAFFDSPSDLAELFRIGQMDWSNLNDFVSKRNCILVADNHNALDDDAPGSASSDSRSTARNFVSGFYLPIVEHKVMFCASANQKSVQLAMGKQDAMFKVSVFGGLTVDELKILMYDKYSVLKDKEVTLNRCDGKDKDKDRYVIAKREAVLWSVN